MKLVISLSLTVLFFASCSLNETTDQQDLDLKRLEDLSNEIIALVDSSVCNDESECDFVAFGSKPCGGPWGYLVFSNSIDTDELMEKVDRFNQLQNSYNIRYNIVSDCSVVMPPTSLICEDNKCKGVYN